MAVHMCRHIYTKTKMKFNKNFKEKRIHAGIPMHTHKIKFSENVKERRICWQMFYGQNPRIFHSFGTFVK